jgi:hypothetical protein
MGLVMAIALSALTTACTQTAEQIESAANRNATSWAMGKPYSQVASLGTSTLAQLSPETAGYGTMIGASRLANGDVIYRHIAPAAKSESSTDFGIFGSATVEQHYRLSYFRVGIDGIVKDFAYGKAPSSLSDCTTYISGIIRQCEDISRVRLSIQAYDNLVRTSTGAALSGWGS